MRTALAATVAVVAVLTGGAAVPAQAAAPHFSNCTAMHRTYRNGVAKSSYAAGHAKPAAIRAPKVSAAIYAANSGMDRDKDGVACEVSR